MYLRVTALEMIEAHQEAVTDQVHAKGNVAPNWGTGVAGRDEGMDSQLFPD